MLITLAELNELRQLKTMAVLVEDYQNSGHRHALLTSWRQGGDRP